MRAAANTSVLIEQVVYLASKAREATGQQPIYDIPKGTNSAQNCPIARALNLNCSVSASAVGFRSAEQAELVAEAIGGTQSGSGVILPPGHPFSAFVRRFDSLPRFGISEKELRALRLGAWR